MERIELKKDAYPTNDHEAYAAYPHLRRVFNKLYVMKSQNIPADKMCVIPKKFPVFIKPIVNLEGSNKDCYFIKNLHQFKKFMHRKDMFWSDYLTGQEKSTDLFLLDGKIMFKMTYVIKIASDDNFLEDYKRIYGDHYQVSEKLLQWTREKYKGHTGVVNIQYRGDTIFETSPRPDYGGTYIEMTGNQTLIDATNELYLKKKWFPKEEILIKKFYEFQVIGRSPFLTTLPNHIIDRILKKHGVAFKELYDDFGEDKKIIYAFFSENKEVGLKAKLLIESMIRNFNICLLILFFSVILLISRYNINNKLILVFLVSMIAFRLLSMHRNANLTKEYSKTLGIF